MALVLAAACSSNASIDASSQPIDLPMQILVSASSVQVYTGAVDLMPCSCVALAFPSVGTCAFLTDANPCDGNPNCRSCFTDLAVEVDGVRLAPTGYGGSDPHALHYDPFPTGHLMLVVAGCGRDTVRIPLDGPGLPNPTVTASYVGGVPTVSWTTDLPSDTAMLTLSGGTHGDLCLEQNVDPYSFTDWTTAQSVLVQAFGSRTELQTAYGSATIWRGGVGRATFP